MTANPLERAVIEAARRYRLESSDPQWIDSPTARSLVEAVAALEAWEETQDPEVCEVGWHEVAEGDQLKSVRNGKFYPVLRVQSVPGGGRRITIRAGEKPISVDRPSPAEPSAFVKRGAVGAAVDVFVNVFTSGGAK